MERCPVEFNVFNSARGSSAATTFRPAKWRPHCHVSLCSYYQYSRVLVTDIPIVIYGYHIITWLSRITAISLNDSLITTESVSSNVTRPLSRELRYVSREVGKSHQRAFHRWSNYWYPLILTLGSVSLGARISQLAIWLKPCFLYWSSYWISNSEILHMPRQKCCRVMCKISLWLNRWNLNIYLPVLGIP